MCKLTYLGKCGIYKYEKRKSINLKLLKVHIITISVVHTCIL